MGNNAIFFKHIRLASLAGVKITNNFPNSLRSGYVLFLLKQGCSRILLLKPYGEVRPLKHSCITSQLSNVIQIAIHYCSNQYIAESKTTHFSYLEYMIFCPEFEMLTLHRPEGNSQLLTKLLLKFAVPMQIKDLRRFSLLNCIADKSDDSENANTCICRFLARFLSFVWTTFTFSVLEYDCQRYKQFLDINKLSTTFYSAVPTTFKFD